MKIAYLGDTIIRGGFGQLDADVMITPIGGDGVFSIKDATSVCIDAQPRIAIPTRWTAPDQPAKFARYIDQFGRGTTTIVMEPQQVLKLEWAAGNEFRYQVN
jgi:L-ascorbate metabolism protein UlaG (beta-lactamase superfamily)